MSHPWRERVEPAEATLAACWPADPDVADDVEAAFRFLGVGSPERLVRASDALGACLSVGVLVAAAVARVAGPPTVVPLALLVGLLPPFVVRRGPVVAAALVRTRTIGAAPSLYGRLVLGLRVAPNLERAVGFAARTGEDRLSESLGGHARRAKNAPEGGLRSFAGDWGDREPGIERATALVVAAARSSPEARRRGCERALSTVLDATADRLARFANDVRGPMTALYAFGVLLPLALVGVLPAASVAGVSVPLTALVVLYDVGLPMGLAGACVWLLARRPVAFPAPRVTRGHPAVPDRRIEGLGVGLAGGAATALLTGAFLPWGAPLTGCAVGIGTGLVVALRPAVAVQDRVRRLEGGLPDALTLVGRRVAEGSSVEGALAATAAELPDATGDLLAAAAERGDVLRLDVSRSFFGPRGVLRDVPSRRARDAATLLALAATEGHPAGDVLVTAGEHLRELRRVEREARRELAAVTGTLANTAVLFGPLVGGVTVAMVGSLAGGSPAAGPGTATAVGVGRGIDPSALGRAVGVYVLVLAAELTALSTALERGLDPTLVIYRVGVALPVASLAYVVAVVVAGQVL